MRDAGVHRCMGVAGVQVLQVQAHHSAGPCSPTSRTHDLLPTPQALSASHHCPFSPHDPPAPVRTG